MEKYTQTHLVHSYECDQDGKLRLLTLFNILQNVADFHAEILNVGYQFFVTKQLAWVGASYALHINERPKWGDTITIRTWPSDKTFVSAIRDFEVLDDKENILITASSQWVLIDIHSGRPQPIKKHIEGLEALPERALDTTFPTINAPEAFNFEKLFHVRYDDIDINKHVNNAIYPVWASEAVPFDFRQANEIEDMHIAFKHPSYFGDEILVHTLIEGEQSTHQLMSSKEAREVARVQIKWKHT